MAGSSEQGHELTVIGRGTTIRGEVDFDQGARILGVFEGKIRSQGEVQIGETAECRAEVNASKVRIEGRLDGNVTARDLLHLSETANVVGDVCATLLHVDEGATFIGHCRVGAEALNNSANPGGTTAGTASTARAPSESRSTTASRTGGASTANIAESAATGVDFKPPWRDSSRSGESSANGEAATAGASNGTA